MRLVLSSRMIKLSRTRKQAVQSHIVSHVSEKLWKSTKRSNVMIQMNPEKIEIYRSKRTVFYKEEINITARKYGIGPRPFSFSVHEIKVMIETRYAANVAPKSDLIQLGSAH